VDFNIFDKFKFYKEAMRNYYRHFHDLRLFFISFLLVGLTSCQQGKEKDQTMTTTDGEPETFEFPFWNHNLPMDERIDDLVSRLTLEEKVSMMIYNSPAIERLGIPEYNWWNECLHGVARNGRATVFPQAIALGATFDDDLLLEVATAISDEARAKFNESVSIGNRGRYAGLTFWSPNVNIYRDPRWGRGQETYGEDPYLTSRLGVAFVKGLQGDHPRYLKAAACAKHYVVHSGPEALRHEFNAVPPEKDFVETYLPAFKALVQEADVEAVMGAYNRTFGEPCCGSPYLLQDILREQWGFKGHILSDCWALRDFHEAHFVTEGPVESAALAINSGINLNCGDIFPYLTDAVEQGLVSEATIDQRLKTLLRTRFKLGLFDPPDMNPYNDVDSDVINKEEHRRLAKEAAEKSIVMLKNDNVLPIKTDLKYIYIVGHHASSNEILLGNYFGVSANLNSMLEGITGKVHPGTSIQYKHATLLDRENPNPIDWSTGEAHEADVIFAIMGISGLIEGEEGEAIASEHKGDRPDIRLPEAQVNYIKKLRSQGDKPIILVLTGGSPIDISEIEDDVDAIIFTWYPGEEGGTAFADIVFGDVNPSGRLPITFPKNVETLPPYEDYSMVGRTYKYMEEEPLYPFGYGLSYTIFEYDKLKLGAATITEGDSLTVSVEVKNAGETAGEEVVQMYLTDLEASSRTPYYSLRGFERVYLEPGETKLVEFSIKPEYLLHVTENGEEIVEPGKFRVTIGGSAPLDRSTELGISEPVWEEFILE
jgi:beta-glucosidase